MGAGGADVPAPSEQAHDRLGDQPADPRHTASTPARARHARAATGSNFGFGSPYSWTATVLPARSCDSRTGTDFGGSYSAAARSGQCARRVFSRPRRAWGRARRRSLAPVARAAPCRVACSKRRIIARQSTSQENGNGRSAAARGSTEACQVPGKFGVWSSHRRGTPEGRHCGAGSDRPARPVRRPSGTQPRAAANGPCAQLATSSRWMSSCADGVGPRPERGRTDDEHRPGGSNVFRRAGRALSLTAGTGARWHGSVAHSIAGSRLSRGTAMREQLLHDCFEVLHRHQEHRACRRHAREHPNRAHRAS